MLADGALERDQHARDELDGRLNSIESEGDVAALGSPEERDQWTRIQHIEAALADAPDNEDTALIRDRLRLVKGVLYFRLNDSFKARIWRERRTIKDLDLALHEAQARWIRVERARKSVPTNNGEFATRIAALQQRIDALQIRLVDAAQKQNGYLAQLAVKELEGQKDRLATYQIQARFALATMYDRAANADITHKETKPKQKGAEDEINEEAPGAEPPADESSPVEQPRGENPPPQTLPPQTLPPAASPGGNEGPLDRLPANESASPPAAPGPKP
jgi:hypothetical protein